MISISDAYGLHVLLPDVEIIVDRVCYGDALVDFPVKLDGQVIVVSADGSSAGPSGIEGSTKFTPSERSGCVDVEFTVPADLPGKFVVFEDFKVGGRTLASHRSLDDEQQSFRQLRRLTLSSSACHSSITASRDGIASTCDVVVLSGGPEDAGLVVSGTVQAFPLDTDGSRKCEVPGPVVEWSVTLDELGSATVQTPEVVLTPGRWDWIAWGSLTDGRESGRTCESDMQVSSEMFGVLPSGWKPSGGIVTTGSDAMTPLRWGALLVALGVVFLVAAHRARRTLLHAEPSR